MYFKNFILFTSLILLFLSNSLLAQYGPNDDFDADGIINISDIDDDNDGIPDHVESPGCFFTQTEAGTIVNVTSQFASPDAFTLLFDGNTTTTTFNFSAATMVVGDNIFTVTFPTAVNLSNLQVTHNITGTAAARARLYGSNDNINFVDLSGSNVQISTTPVNFSVNQNAGNYLYYKIQCEVGGSLATANTIAEIVGTISSPYIASLYPKPSCGVLNHFNLDSDGDGCSDALEGGSTKNITSNYAFSAPFGSNGLADAVETAVDNGILNYTLQYGTYGNNSSLNFCDLYVSDSGKVFMDFNGDGLQSSHLQEPGLKNITVRAYKPDGSFLDVQTDSLGMYTFTGAQIPAGTKIRLEFINIPAGIFDGFKAGSSNTTVQFITTGVNDVSAGLALSIPNHYSSTLNPYYAFIQYRRNNGAASEQTIWFLDDNNSVNFIPANTLDATRNWSMPNVSGVSNFPIPTRYEAANQGEIGSTLGLAWNKRMEFLLAGAFMRGYCDLGTNSSANGFGEGVIYKIPINTSGVTAANPVVWLDLETILGDDIAGTYIADGAHPGPTVYGRTNANPNKIGFTGLGMMKFTNDGTKLLVTNLKTLEVFVIPVDPNNGNALVSAPADIKRFTLPTQDAPGNWANGNPYRSILGLGIHPVTGRAYVSITCNGPTLADLKGVIYSFDPHDNTPDSSDFVRELEIPLNILRPATNPNIGQWYDQVNHPWENMAANTTVYSNANNLISQNNHPWLGEIVFDALPDGSFGLSVSERNRFHDVINSSFYVAGGPIYRATFNGTNWQLENNQVAGPLTSTVTWTYANANRAGSNTSVNNRFYKYVGAEGTFGNGTIAHVPGSNEIIAAAMDNVFYSGTSGVTWLNRITGERSRDARHISDFTTNGFYSNAFTKANNFGDLEILGEMPPLEIGNRVWLDVDQDGVQDPNENGIAGVVVNLYQGTTLVGTTITASDGSYYFTDANVNLNGATGILPNTTYEIRISISQTPLNTLVLTGTNTDGTPNGDARDNDGTGATVAVINLTTGDYGENNHTYDFGYMNVVPPDPACLGNYVWNDKNQDGIQNNNEVGVSGVTVSLLNSSNTILATVTTDAYGFYQFCQLTPGDYKVKFSLPSNYVFTSQNNPSNDETDSDPNTTTGITDIYTLASGDSNMTADAGIFEPIPNTATVGDKVWFDANNNGIQEPGENGVSGVTVSLYNCANPTTPIATTITDASGNYLFENLVPGNYSVGFSLPIGTIFTTQSGSVSATDNSDADISTGKSACFSVNAGDNILYVDAGIIPQTTGTASLGDKVWNDANQDGIQDPNETGVSGVTVTLYDATGTTIIKTITTDGLGNYGFNDLTPGCYMVGFSNIPIGYTLTSQNSGTDTSKNSDANTGTGMTNPVCLSAGQNNPTIDAGIYNPANTNSIGDKVWYDENRNGEQDPTEYGYPGVVVTLYNCVSNAIIATTTTKADGSYLFDGLANGSYYVGFGFIGGYQFTSQNADLTGLAGVNNSDANPSSGLTECVNLTGNTNITTVDAGIYPGNNRTATSSLGDKVWLDMNQDGIQDAGEPGVPNVTVNLYNCSDLNTAIATTVTDGLGNYIFTNLVAGSYAVGFSDIPVGYSFTTAGTNIEDENNSDANVTTGKTACIPLGLGEDKMNVDAGIIAPANTVCLGNYVWIDLNNNGTQESTEPAVPGVTVKLYDNNTNTVLQVATTTTEGNYMFCGLTPGNTYSVGFENLPPGYNFTQQNGALNITDNSDANLATGRTTTVTLGTTNDITLDAGIYSATTAVVGNYVWIDVNADGIQDSNEPPIPGVLVTLYDITNTPVASAVTDAKGLYLFTNVQPGTYTIGFEGYPNTLVPTTKGSNASADDDSNVDPGTIRTDAFTVTPGSSNLTLDAGFKANPIAGLGNYVWHDVDNDGIQEANELPLSGVIVTLYSQDGTTELAKAITDGNGAYSFPNLTADSYIVGFTPPPGYTRTQTVGPLNDPLNSDVDATNKTSVVSLSAGQYNPNIDAGYYIGTPLTAAELVATMAIKFGTDRCNVHWYTKEEDNSLRFIIERSIDGATFVPVGELNASHHTQGRTDYQYNDNISQLTDAERIYYRIVLEDIDQKRSVSNIVSVDLNEQSTRSIVVYPIPFEDKLTIDYLAEEEADIQIVITDLSGRMITSLNKELVVGLNTVTLENLSALSSGNYCIKIHNSTTLEDYIRKIVKK